MSFREDVAARYSRKISYFRAVLAPTHNTREKKKERNLFLFCRHFFISRAFIALGFPSLLTPRVRVGGCLYLFVRRTVCTWQHRTGFLFRFHSGKRKAPTHSRGEKESKTLKTKTIKDGQRGLDDRDVVQKSLRHSLRQSRHARGHARPRRRG